MLLNENKKKESIDITILLVVFAGIPCIFHSGKNAVWIRLTFQAVLIIFLEQLFFLEFCQSNKDSNYQYVSSNCIYTTNQSIQFKSQINKTTISQLN